MVAVYCGEKAQIKKANGRGPGQFRPASSCGLPLWSEDTSPSPVSMWQSAWHIANHGRSPEHSELLLGFGYLGTIDQSIDQLIDQLITGMVKLSLQAN